MHKILKGNVDIYICVTCGTPHSVISMNVGMIAESVVCKKCHKSFAKTINEDMGAFFKQSRVHNLQIVFCWYRPTIEEYLTLDNEKQQFVRKGALLWGMFGEVKFIHDLLWNSAAMFDVWLCKTYPDNEIVLGN